MVLMVLMYLCCYSLAADTDIWYSGIFIYLVTFCISSHCSKIVLSTPATEGFFYFSL